MKKYMNLININTIWKFWGWITEIFLIISSWKIWELMAVIIFVIIPLIIAISQGQNDYIHYITSSPELNPGSSKYSPSHDLISIKNKNIHSLKISEFEDLQKGRNLSTKDQIKEYFDLLDKYGEEDRKFGKILQDTKNGTEKFFPSESKKLFNEYKADLLPILDKGIRERLFNLITNTPLPDQSSKEIDDLSKSSNQSNPSSDQIQKEIDNLSKLSNQKNSN